MNHNGTELLRWQLLRFAVDEIEYACIYGVINTNEIVGTLCATDAKEQHYSFVLCLSTTFHNRISFLVLQQMSFVVPKFTSRTNYNLVLICIIFSYIFVSDVANFIASNSNLQSTIIRIMEHLRFLQRFTSSLKILFLILRVLQDTKENICNFSQYQSIII